MSEPSDRSTFRSALGAALATAGVAIGLGNIWRFPYMMGRDGGAAFLALYLVIMAAFGAPMLMAEWAIGRRTRRGPWGAYERLGVPFGRWWGAALLVMVVMAASYYGVVVAWTLQSAASALLAGLRDQPELRSFASLTCRVGEQFGYLVIVVALGCLVLGLGVRRGIERVSGAALPLFFLILLAVLARVLTLDGAVDGLRSFLAPRFGDVRGGTALSALGQAVFSLGLGGVFMVLYGSYMRDDHDLPRAAILTVAADLGAAVLAGLVVVPAVLALGLDLASGPSLLFEVMPRVFEAMPAGAIVGALFFFAVFVVAMLSLIAAYEVIVAMLGDGLGWSRRRALIVIFITQVALATPAYLVANYVAVSDLIWGTTMQPLGAALAVVAFGWWLSRAQALGELRRSSALPVPMWLHWWVRWVIPGVILVILAYGWWDRLSSG